jgi:hypothetical protein
MMWYVPEDWNENDLFIWYLIWHSIFFTVITVRYTKRYLNSILKLKTGIIQFKTQLSWIFGRISE